MKNAMSFFLSLAPSFILSEKTEKNKRHFTNKKIGITVPTMATQLKIVLPSLNTYMKEQQKLYKNRTWNKPQVQEL
jgi:hypothetical protein